MIHFDIFTVQGARKFLCEALRLNERELFDISLAVGFDSMEFYGRIRDSLCRAVSSADLLLHLRHVTSNTDECRSIVEHGLVGIRDVLALKNDLSSLFKKCGVEYDGEHGIVEYLGQRALLNSFERADACWDYSPFGNMLYILAEDSYVNSFFHVPCMRNYSTIAKYPEAVEALEKLVGYGNDAIWEWRQKARPYVVEFIATVEELLVKGNVLPDKSCDYLWEGVGCESEAVFNNLIFQSISVFLQDNPDFIALMPSNPGVRSSSIVNITPLDVFCGSPDSYQESMCDRGSYCSICSQ